MIGKKRRRFAIGDRTAFDDQPALGAMRAGELPVQSRLADAGLADDGDHLAVPGSGALQRLSELVQFAVRPTKRVRPRAAAACSRDADGAAPVTS